MTLIGENFPPPTGGMVKSAQPHLLGADQCEFMLDMVVDSPGVVRSRGGFTSDYTLLSTPGTLDTYTLNGYPYLLAVPSPLQTSTVTNAPWLIIDEVNRMSIVDGTFSVVKQGLMFSVGTYAYYTPTPNKSVIVSGLVTGISTSTATSFEWFGGTVGGITNSAGGATALTGTHTVASTGIVTGVGSAYTTELSVGTVVWGTASGAPIGVVKSISSNTTFELDDSPWDGRSGALTLSASLFMRPLFRPAQGTVTTRSTQSTVFGAGTAFQQFSTAAATQDAVFARNTLDAKSTFLGYALYDPAADNPLNFSFRTLGATTTTNALADMDNAYWFGMPTGTTSNQNRRSSHAFEYHQGRGFYYRQWDTAQPDIKVYYSALTHHWDVNSTNSGSWFNYPASKRDPLMRAFSSPWGLLFFNGESGVRILRGTDPLNFVLSVLHPSRIVSPTAVTMTPMGVVWLADDGLWLFDGNRVSSLTDKLFGSAFKQSMFKSLTEGNMAATVIYSSGYLMVHVRSAGSPAGMPVSDYPGVSVPAMEGNNGTVYNPYYPHNPCYALHVPSGAWTVWQNYGYTQAVKYSGKDYLVGLYAAMGGTTRKVILTDMDNVLNGVATDNMVAINGMNPLNNMPGLFGTSSYFVASGTPQGWMKGGDTLGGVYTQYDHRAGLCALKADGTAYTGTFSLAGNSTYQVQNTFNNAGTFEAECQVTLPTFSATDTSNWISNFYTNSSPRANEVILVRGRTNSSNGWRVTVGAVTITVETVTFNSSTGWTVSSPSTIYTITTNGSSYNLSFEHTGTTIIGYKVTHTANTVYLSWQFGRKRDPMGPTPYLITRAFHKPGMRMWLRKFRMFFRSSGDLSLRTVDNMDGDYLYSTAVSPDTVTLTSSDATDEAQGANVNQPTTVFFGSRADTFQVILARKVVGSSAVFRLFNATLLYKMLRGGRR